MEKKGKRKKYRLGGLGEIFGPALGSNFDFSISLTLYDLWDVLSLSLVLSTEKKRKWQKRKEEEERRREWNIGVKTPRVRTQYAQAFLPEQAGIDENRLSTECGWG